MNMKKSAIALAISAIAVPALALSPSVGDPGFSGSVNLGVGAGKVKTNFLAEVVGIDLSDDKLTTIGDPDDKSVTMPVAEFDLGWTFSSGKTRVLFGSDEGGRFSDFTPGVQIGARYDADQAGHFQLVGLMSDGATRVYEDPYQLGSKRGQSEISRNGGRFNWDQMFSSNFELMLEARNIDVDKERSGEQAFGSDPAARKLLKRDGDMYKATLGYKYEVNDRHTLRPSIGYVDYDLDGDAMSQKGALIELGYSYKADSFDLSLAGLYGKLDGDERTPFASGDKNDTDRYQIAGGMDFAGLFGLKNWVPNITAIYAKDDSDIDFNDTEGWMFMVGMHRTF